MGKDQELLEAARNGNVAVVEKILNQRAKRSGPLASLRRGPGANVQDSSGYTPLHHAALNGHKEIVQQLLEHEASPNVPDTKGSSPLHLAAWAGHTAIVRLLLTHGPALTNVNLTTRDNETALHCAAQYGHTAVVVMLLNHGADPTVKSVRDETALDLASQYGRLETVELLVRTHPELLELYRHPRGILPHTPLHRASRNGHKAVVNVLLAAGHSPSARTPSGTALHEAALCGKAAAARALLAGGADPRARDTRGATVLDVLAQFPERATHDIVALINKYRSSNGTDSSGEDLPPIPVAGDSPYDNVRPPGVAQVPQGAQTLTGARRHPQPGVWERRGEDERRVSATSNISMNSEATSSPNKLPLSPSPPAADPGSKSKYMHLLSSNCFGLKYRSSSASNISSNSIGYYKNPKPFIKEEEEETLTKSIPNVSTLRVGKSKFFRRKSSVPDNPSLVLQESDLYVSKSSTKPRRYSSVNIPSLPNIFERIEIVTSSDSDDSMKSCNSVANPLYSQCGSVQDLLELMKSHSERESTQEPQPHVKNPNSDEEDNARKELDEMRDMFGDDLGGVMGSPLQSARSSFEFQSNEPKGEITITKKSQSCNEKKIIKKPLRLSHSNRTLKNWTTEQDDFKNDIDYSKLGIPVSPSKEDNPTGLKPSNPLYYAMLDFTNKANSYRKIEKEKPEHHIYEPYDFENNYNYDVVESPVHATIRETSFKPIEVFRESSTVFVEEDLTSLQQSDGGPITVDNISNEVIIGPHSSEESLEDLLTFRNKVHQKPVPPPRPKGILIPKIIPALKSVSDTSRSLSLCSTTNSRKSSVTSFSSWANDSLLNAGQVNRESQLYDDVFTNDVTPSPQFQQKKLVQIQPQRISVESFVSGSSISRRSSTEHGPENSYLPMNAVLQFSRDGSKSDNVSTLRQVTEPSGPHYQNMVFVSNPSNSTLEGKLTFTRPAGTSSYHVRGSDQCIYDNPVENEYIYVFNRKSVKDMDTQPFIRARRGLDADSKICFCEKRKEKSMYLSADNLSSDNSTYGSSAKRFSNASSGKFVCYCEDSCCDSHHTKIITDSSLLLSASYSKLSHSVSFPNLLFSESELENNYATMPLRTKRSPSAEPFNIVFNTPLADSDVYDTPSAFVKCVSGPPDERDSTTSSVSFHTISDRSPISTDLSPYVEPNSFPYFSSPTSKSLSEKFGQETSDLGNLSPSDPRFSMISTASFYSASEDIYVVPDPAARPIDHDLTLTNASKKMSENGEDASRSSLYLLSSLLSSSDQSLNNPTYVVSEPDTSSNSIDEDISPKFVIQEVTSDTASGAGSSDLSIPETHSIDVNVASSTCDCPLDAKGGSSLCVCSGSDGGHFPYSKSQLMEGSYHSEELCSSYQGRIREADQLSISSTTSSTGGPSPRERQRCGTNDSSVSGGNIYLPMATSGYHAHSPGSNNKVSPTPPKKPPRRNLSVSPTHLLPPSLGFSTAGGGAVQQVGSLARHQQTRSQDDLDDLQAPGSKLTSLRHGRSVDQYVDNDLKTSPRARPIPQPRPSLALLAASRKEQPIAISTMYENVVVKEQNPRRKLRRNPTNPYENFQPKELNNVGALDGESKNQRYNSSQERSSLESLLDDVGSYTPSDVESRTCKVRPTIQTPLSPTHYDQPPTPDHPPPSARQAEKSIHERMRPLSQEYKRMSRDMETETDPRLLGRCSSPSSSASTDHCVEEYVAEVPFAGLFKGSTTTLDGVGQRPTPAERPKSLRTLKSVYDGGGLSTSQGPQQTTNSLAQSYHPSYPITNNSHNNTGNLSQSYHGSQNSQNSLNQTYRNQGNKNSNHYSGHANQSSQASIADRGPSKAEFEDPWQYRTGREPKDHDRKESGTNQTSGGLERSLSILSPFDEQEEWAKISEIMASFGTRLVRESVFAEELEREFQLRLGLAGAMARKSPSPAPEQMLARPETVPAWLASIGLSNLEANLVGNGYDELDFINGVIEDNDFSEMAIEDPEKTKILEASKVLPMKIDEVLSLPPVIDNHNNNISNKEEKANDPEEVNKWLKSIGLDIYQDTFRKHLYADMERVRRIWEVELTAVLEIQRVGHRRRILASVAGRQNGPVSNSNMEDIKADLNNLQKNQQNQKAEIKDIPLVDPASIPCPQIPMHPPQKSPSIQNQTVNQKPGDQNQNTGTLKSNSSNSGPTLVVSGGETLKRSHKKNRPPPPPPARGADLEIRAPCELLVGVPGALKTQWRHQPFVLVTSSVMYVANYLGSTVVRELRGTESTQKSIQKLKKTNSEPRALPDIILSISYRGVKFLNTITKELVCEHEIRNIHCACQDADDLTHFAYITKDITSKSHYCHVFCVATMDQATEVILTLGQAFEVAYQMALRDLAPKPNPNPAPTQLRSTSSNQITPQQLSKTPTHEKPTNIIAKEKSNLHGRSHSVTEIKLNGHQLKVAPMTVSLSNEDFQTVKTGDVQRSPRTPSAKAPIAVAEEL